ncbi:MAG: hypothetical protein QW321_00375, partial [Candidatus Aenigmatarchaeota archaeon]
KRSPEALQSASNDLKALQSDEKALQERFKALQIATPETKIQTETPQPETLELEKESLQLGIAAGYTGRALKEIEASLNRIETQMVSKDWLLSKFEIPVLTINEIKEILKQHDENMSRKFEIIQNSIESLKKTAEISPEPIKTEIMTQIEKIESQLPLTPKMEEVLAIIREHKEISYKDLAQKLGWKDTSGLRGLLSNMVKRTDKIERFEKDGQGWVRYRFEALQSGSNPFPSNLKVQ